MTANTTKSAATLYYLYFANGRRPDGYWLDHAPTSKELAAYAKAGLALATVGRTYTFTRWHDFGDYRVTRTELLDAAGEVCQVRDTY